MPSEGPVRRARWFRWIPLVGLVVYFTVVWVVGWDKVRGELATADVSMVLAAGGLTLLATWSRAWKWRLALGAGRHSTALFFLSKAAGNWSPGRVGEFSPLVWRRHRNARVAAWIALDRLLEIATTLGLGVAGLWTLSMVPKYMSGVVTVGVVVSLGVGFWLLTRRGLLLRWARQFGRGTRVRTALRALASVSREMRAFAFVSLPAGGITILMKVIDLWAVTLLFAAFGSFPGFWPIAASKCALAMVSFLPVTPPATMIPHGVQAWLLHEESGVTYEVLAAVIGVEVVVISVTFWSSFGLASGAIRRALGRQN